MAKQHRTSHFSADEPRYLAALNYGFQRVLASCKDGPLEVTYLSPNSHKRLKSIQDVRCHLENHECGQLETKNFVFTTEPLNHANQLRQFPKQSLPKPRACSSPRPSPPSPAATESPSAIAERALAKPGDYFHCKSLDGTKMRLQLVNRSNADAVLPEDERETFENHAESERVREASEALLEEERRHYELCEGAVPFIEVRNSDLSYGVARRREPRRRDGAGVISYDEDVLSDYSVNKSLNGFVGRSKRLSGDKHLDRLILNNVQHPSLILPMDAAAAPSPVPAVAAVDTPPAVTDQHRPSIDLLGMAIQDCGLDFFPTDAAEVPNTAEPAVEASAETIGNARPPDGCLETDVHIPPADDSPSDDEDFDQAAFEEYKKNRRFQPVFSDAEDDDADAVETGQPSTELPPEPTLPPVAPPADAPADDYFDEFDYSFDVGDDY